MTDAVDQTQEAVPTTFPYTLKGRIIQCKISSGGQRIMTQRLLRNFVTRRDTLSEQQAGTLIEQLLDCAESLIIDEADVTYVQGLMLTGAIELGDVLPILFGRDADALADTADDDQPKAAKQAAKKAAVKPKKLPRKTATANARRVTR